MQAALNDTRRATRRTAALRPFVASASPATAPSRAFSGPLAVTPGRRHGTRRGAPASPRIGLVARGRDRRGARARGRADGRRLHGCTTSTIARTPPAGARKAAFRLENTRLKILYEEYSPYGASAFRSSRSGVEVSAKRYRYVGLECDDETGLYSMGARYYAAWLGRWTSADPMGIGADGPGLYNYTRGSPVVFTDPGGMKTPEPTDAIEAEQFSGNDEIYPAAMAELQAARAAEVPQLEADPVAVLGTLDGDVRAELATAQEEIYELLDSLERGGPTRVWDLEHWTVESIIEGIGARTSRLQALEASGLAYVDEQGWYQSNVLSHAVESGAVTDEQSEAYFKGVSDATRRNGIMAWNAGRMLELGLAIIPGGKGAGALFAKAPVAKAAALKTLNTEAKALGFAGKWKNTGETMSVRAAEFQTKVTGVEAGASFAQGGVKFDGLSKTGTLLDAKGPGYANFVQKKGPKAGEFYDWFAGKESLVSQAQSQVRAAGDTPIEWVFAEQAAMDATMKLLTDAGVDMTKLTFRLH